MVLSLSSLNHHRIHKPSPPPAPKRLIVCCDGSFQSSVTGERNIPSNVTRLARTIAKSGEDADGKIWQQMVYYDSGVGTGSLNWIEQARQGATGDGLVTNVLEAYNFLVNNYCEGDQIFCFGFSRGAFTAKAIAGLVTDIGIFKPNNMQAFAPLWAKYKENVDKHDFRKSKEFFQYVHGLRPMVPEGKENEPYELQPHEVPYSIDFTASDGLTWKNSNIVEVVGCFDTVGSLGLGDTYLQKHGSSRRRFEFLNVKLSPFIKHAFHALALDERREPFTPTLWYIPNQETIQEEDDKIDKEDDDWEKLKEHRDAINEEIKNFQAAHPPDLYQVWFPGVHINIGGGSSAESGADIEGLSNVTFAWMVQQLGPYLTFEPWTWGWDGIAGYQHRVMQEEKMYGERGHKRSGSVEKLEHAVSNWGHWVWEAGKRTLGLSKEVKLVPVNPKMIRLPEEPRDNKDIKWGVGKYTDSYTLLYRVISAPLNRSPGTCRDRSKEGGKLLSHMGRTNEYIHPSVWRRYETMKDEKTGEGLYTSDALKGFERVQDPKYGSWGWWNESEKLWIPEWFMKPTDCYLAEAGMKHGAWKDHQAWEHAEWAYTENVYDSEDLQKQIAGFYVDAMDAQIKMEADGKLFPFEVTIDHEPRVNGKI